MICLDSTFIIDFLRNDKQAVKKVDELKPGVFTTTSISIFETIVGIHLMKHNKDLKIDKLKEMIDNIYVLNFDLKSSFLASEVAADLIKKGNIINDLDNLIVGSMLSHGCNTIVTRDKHFSRIKGIKVIRY